MSKPKKKLTAAQRAAKKRRSKEFETVFINGKQVRVRRPPTIEGLDPDEFILRNADPIWLQQNGYCEFLHMREMEEQNNSAQFMPPTDRSEDADDIPF